MHLSGTRLMFFSKMKTKKIPQSEIVIPKFNKKIVERGKIDSPKTQKHDHSLSCMGTGN
jgi:hypothetical protein